MPENPKIAAPQNATKDPFLHDLRTTGDGEACVCIRILDGPEEEFTRIPLSARPFGFTTRDRHTEGVPNQEGRQNCVEVFRGL